MDPSSKLIVLFRATPKELQAQVCQLRPSPTEWNSSASSSASDEDDESSRDLYDGQLDLLLSCRAPFEKATSRVNGQDAKQSTISSPVRQDSGSSFGFKPPHPSDRSDDKPLMNIPTTRTLEAIAMLLDQVSRFLVRLLLPGDSMVRFAVIQELSTTNLGAPAVPVQKRQQAPQMSGNDIFAVRLASKGAAQLALDKLDFSCPLHLSLNRPGFFIEDSFSRRQIRDLVPSSASGSNGASANGNGADAKKPMRYVAPGARNRQQANALLYQQSVPQHRGQKRTERLLPDSLLVSVSQLITCILSGKMDNGLLKSDAKSVKFKDATVPINQRLACHFGLPLDSTVTVLSNVEETLLDGVQAVSDMIEESTSYIATPTPILLMDSEADTALFPLSEAHRLSSSVLIRDESTWYAPAPDPTAVTVSFKAADSRLNKKETVDSRKLLVKAFPGNGMARSQVCAKFTNSSWKTFKHLSESVPMGGSIGLDSKVGVRRTVSARINLPRCPTELHFSPAQQCQSDADVLRTRYARGWDRGFARERAIADREPGVRVVHVASQSPATETGSA